MKKLLFIFVIIFNLFACVPEKKVLIIGDSISLGYTPFLQEKFKNDVIIKHNPGNAKYTWFTMHKIESWLKEEDYDLVLFNYGLWDLCYVVKQSNKLTSDRAHGKQLTPIEDYRINLDQIINTIKNTSNAKIAFVGISYVPENEKGRIVSDALKYNSVAKEVAQINEIEFVEFYEESKVIHESFGKAQNDVHYTPAGYKKLSEALFDDIKKLLE